MSSPLQASLIVARLAGGESRPALQSDRLRGILAIIAAAAVFSVSDTTAKYLTQSLPVVEIAWIRYIVFVLLTCVPALRRGPAGLRTRQPKVQVLRGIAIIGSALFFIWGVRSLPLADATSLSFASPLIITALSVPVLGETVGLRRWLAVSAGMVGVLTVVQPGTDAFQPSAVLPLLSASAWAVGMIVTRRLAATDSTATTLAWTALIGLLVSSVLLPFDFRVPTLNQVALGVLVGVVSTIGQGFVALAYRLAPASLVAPFSYSQLISASFMGYLVFAARPGAATLLGAAVIAASGLYIAQQERRRR